ncbi:MAG TPA: hypothetical protein VJM69_00060 [Dehalococcoidia bacterium]|nr:hypothetical protein [Dehalococcoidia bacterium]
MLPEVIVVVELAQGFVQQLLRAFDSQDTGDVALLVISAIGDSPWRMGAFQVGVLFRVALRCG